jgi:hypothetical protein
MSWIELHGQLFFHPKTVIAASELTRGDAEKLVGHLARLWTWAIDHAENGDLAHLSDRAIAEAAGWRRTPKRFVAALTVAGFLDADRRIHDWDDYAGKLLDRRRADRERTRRDYATRRQAISPLDSPQETPPDIRTHLTRPYRTVPNQVLTDTDVPSGQVSHFSPSGGTTSMGSRSSRLSEAQLLEATGLLVENAEWPLNLTDTRMVLEVLAKENFPDGDLADALAYYNDFLIDSPLDAKTPKSVMNAMRPWLRSWLRRDYLSTLMSRGDASDGERARQVLVDKIGTDQYSEMSNTDVEAAITLLDPANAWAS